MHLEEQIRNRAYELWTLEGRPGERALDHWFQAAQEFAMSAFPAAPAAYAAPAVPAAEEAKPRKAPPAKAKAASPAAGKRAA